MYLTPLYIAGMLVDCTSLDVCPYATPHYSLALNRTVLVNRAPVNINSGLVMVSAALTRTHSRTYNDEAWSVRRAGPA